MTKELNCMLQAFAGIAAGMAVDYFIVRSLVKGARKVKYELARSKIHPDDMRDKQREEAIDESLDGLVQKLSITQRNEYLKLRKQQGMSKYDALCQVLQAA